MRWQSKRFLRTQIALLELELEEAEDRYLELYASKRLVPDLTQKQLNLAYILANEAKPNTTEPYSVL